MNGVRGLLLAQNVGRRRLLVCQRLGDERTSLRLANSEANVQGFGCRPWESWTRAPGRRPKAVKERTRGRECTEMVR